MRKEKIVYECRCDVCDKEIPAQGKHYVVRLTAGSWVNDTITEELEKDLCSDCYNALKDIINLDNKPVSKKTTKKLSRKGEVKHRITDAERHSMEEMFMDGKSFAEIGRKLHIPPNTVQHNLKNHMAAYDYYDKKRKGLLPKEVVKETKYGAKYKTVVSPNGMVERVEVIHGE